MSTNKHTPGPWRAEGWRGMVVNAADGSTIVCMPGGGYNASEAELQANARLIAAAPDLLEALREMLSDAMTMREPFRNAAICERASAAIAKATGGAS